MTSKILVCIPVLNEENYLLEIDGKTILQIIYEKVKKLGKNKIVILTTSEKVKKNTESFSHNSTHIIKDKCLNKTELIVSYLSSSPVDADTIMNYEEENPFFKLNFDNLLINNFFKFAEDTVCHTIYYSTFSNIDIMSKSKIKLVLDKNKNILYASRSVIPGTKNGLINNSIKYRINIGLLIYKKKYLIEEFPRINTPNQLCEDIDWLKIIDEGKKIKAYEINF